VEGKVSLVNCSFWGPIDRCVWMRSASGQFTASACNFVNWDNRGVGSPAIQLDAGKAIVQGCTFSQDELQVQIGSNVTSAILTANQAAGGFRMDNQAGKRTQAALNEEDAIEWSPEARTHYQINIGEPGAGRYLQGWHTSEGATRWSTPLARLLLPVVPGKPYTITLKVNIPPAAISPAAGLYLDGQQIVSLKSGDVVTASLPSSQQDRIRLELRCQGWVPNQLSASSKDPRTLGVQGISVNMRAADAGEKVFNANTGQWLPTNVPSPK